MTSPNGPPKKRRKVLTGPRVQLIGIILTSAVAGAGLFKGGEVVINNIIGPTTTTTSPTPPPTPSPSTTSSTTTQSPPPLSDIPRGTFQGTTSNYPEVGGSTVVVTLFGELNPVAADDSGGINMNVEFTDVSPQCTIGADLIGPSTVHDYYHFELNSGCTALQPKDIYVSGSSNDITVTMTGNTTPLVITASRTTS